MNNRMFVPNFLEDLIASAGPDKLKKAETACGQSKMCLFDTLALDDESIGQATMMLNIMNTEGETAGSKFNNQKLCHIPANKI